MSQRDFFSVAADLAMIDGEVPPVVDIVYKNDSSDLWITERMNVNPVDPETEKFKNSKGEDYEGKAVFTFGDLIEPLTFYCIGGDDLEYDVEAAHYKGQHRNIKDGGAKETSALFDDGCARLPHFGDLGENLGQIPIYIEIFRQLKRRYR